MGNLTSTYAGTTATLTYDVLDHLVAWNAGSTNQEWYTYDASGNRVLRRSTTGSGTSITTYAFGLEEHLYGATGINTGNTYYYYLGGRLIGDLTGITTLTTQFFLTDALGSVLATFSAIAGSAAVLGNQVYGPYGNQRYTQGSMGTAKGYTGQYADGTGLDYYNARYYDPIVGRFVSADTVQGNEQGMDPYAYVAGNPETMNDPTGHWGWGAAAAVIGLAAGVTLGVGLFAGAAITMPIWLPVLAGGVFIAFACSAMVGATTGAFTSNDNFDNWGFRTLIAEGIGGASALLGYGLGNGWQSLAENTNGGMVPNPVPGSSGTVFKTTLNATQKAVANQSGQQLGNAIGAGVGTGINLLPIHAPGIGSKSTHHSTPAPKKAPVARRVAVKLTYTHKTTRSYYNPYTRSSYSYTSAVYHYTNPSYNYTTFSASNGYYQVTRGGMRMS